MANREQFSELAVLQNKGVTERDPTCFGGFKVGEVGMPLAWYFYLFFLNSGLVIVSSKSKCIFIES